MSEDQNRTLSDKITLRMPEGLRERIKSDANLNKRSLNAEIVATLEERYPEPDLDQEFKTFVVAHFLAANTGDELLAAFKKCREELDKRGYQEDSAVMAAAIFELRRQQLKLPELVVNGDNTTKP